MIIHANDLKKIYELGGQTVRALDGVSLTVEEGEMLSLIGPSGSGKSTLMNVLGCLDTPDAGEYWLAGENVAKLSRDRLAEIRNSRIGFVFQSFNLLPRVSALENVELPLHYSGRRDARHAAEAAMELVGLKDRMHHKPNELSGGQRQRVAIARAVVTNPAIVLADEPTGALDSKTGEEVMGVFHSLNAQGRTIIIVTHDADVAAHCPRAIHLRDGKIVDPETAHPASGITHAASE